jgi:hypothetical protein
MDSFTPDDLRALLGHQRWPCVFFLLRTTPGGHNQDRTRWKGLLQEAERLLRGGGERGPDVKALLAPARDLLDDSQFWLNVADGLAAFLTPGLFRLFRVPPARDDCVLVGDGFPAEGLALLLSGAGRD